MSIGLWEMVENGYTKPNFKERLIENHKKNLKEDKIWNVSAFSMLHKDIVDPIFPRIMRVAKAKDA